MAAQETGPAESLGMSVHTLETERLLLRRFVDSDAEAFFRLNSEPDIVRFTARKPLAHVDEAKAVLASAAFRTDEQIGLGRFACGEKTTGQVIGLVGLKPPTELAHVDMGFRFLKEVWGKGYATEAAAAIIQYAKATLLIERVIATVFPENIGSIRVLEKLGLTLTGIVRLAVAEQELLLYQ